LPFDETIKGEVLKYIVVGKSRNSRIIPGETSIFVLCSDWIKGLFRWLSGLFHKINITFETYNKGISDSLKEGQYVPVNVIL